MDQEARHEPGAPRPEETEDIPFGQVIFDNIWLWLALGVAVPLLSYTVWGLLDIASTPILPP